MVKKVYLKKIKMITSDEAQKLSREGAKIKLLPLVEAVIKNAANSGEDSVMINSDNVTNHVRKILNEHGYFVGAVNNNKVQISWQEKTKFT
jgi:hypothetical protein